MYVEEGTLTSLGQYLTSGISAGVRVTAPMASAFETSMDLTFAWAWGLLRILPYIMLGRVMSDANISRPVTLAMPSFLTVFLPRTLNSLLSTTSNHLNEAYQWGYLLISQSFIPIRI